MEPIQYRLLAEVEDEHWWHRTLREAVRAALAKHAPARRLRVLDAGCGTGGLLDALRREHHVCGLDLSPLALGHCRNRALDQLVRGRIDRLPFAARSFEAAISIDVLSHGSIVSDLTGLEELCRVLVPGGLLVLQLSAFAWLAGEHDAQVHQVRRYGRRQVLRLLRRAGFVPLSARYRLAFLPPLMVLNNLRAALSETQPGEDIALPAPPLNTLLRAVAALDQRLGRWVPFGSSIFCVARRRELR